MDVSESWLSLFFFSLYTPGLWTFQKWVWLLESKIYVHLLPQIKGSVINIRKIWVFKVSDLSVSWRGLVYLENLKRQASPSQSGSFPGVLAQSALPSPSAAQSWEAGTRLALGPGLPWELGVQWATHTSFGGSGGLMSCENSTSSSPEASFQATDSKYGLPQPCTTSSCTHDLYAYAHTQTKPLSLLLVPRI